MSVAELARVDDFDDAPVSTPPETEAKPKRSPLKSLPSCRNCAG